MNFQEKYTKEIVSALKKELNIKNIMSVPRIQKITVNIGFGSILSKRNEKKTDKYSDVLAKITGQKPVVNNAKKSISNFKLRVGMPIGATVTLRKSKMYDFLERFITVAIPRIRDFRGFAKRGDGKGNLSIGIYEHVVFPEVGEQEAADIHGLQVSITTSAKNDQEMFLLLEKFGFPFKKV